MNGRNPVIIRPLRALLRTPFVTVETTSMFKKLIPVIALALIAGPAFAQSTAAPAAAPAASSTEASKDTKATHKKKHHKKSEKSAEKSESSSSAPPK